MKNIFVIFRLCCIGSLCTFGMVVAQGACDPAPAGMVSWWAAEGNTLDQISGNDGTLQNGAGFTTGKVGQAFVFAGSGEAVQLGNPTDLQLQDFTIETWIQRGSASISTPDPGQTTAVFLAYGYGGYGFGIYADGSLFLTRVGIDAVTVPNLITDYQLAPCGVDQSGNQRGFLCGWRFLSGSRAVYLGVQFCYGRGDWRPRG